MGKATIGPREQALRDMRAEDTPVNLPKKPARKRAEVDQALASARGRKLDAAMSDPNWPYSAQPQETTVKKTTKKTKAKPAAKPAKSEKKVDRSPLAVGTFIAAGGTDGVTMAAIEKRFKMDAHPLRAKIFAARHKLGFAIEHDPKRGVYVGTAPAPGAGAAGP